MAYDSGARRVINSVSAKEPLLTLLEIHHKDLAQPIRLVNDNQDIMSNGKLYQSFPFSITKPDDKEGQVAKARISIDNVGRELTQWLEYSRGGVGARAIIREIVPSRPNVVQYEVTMDLTNLAADLLTVTGELEFSNFFNQSAVTKTYRPETQAGLF